MNENRLTAFACFYKRIFFSEIQHQNAGFNSKCIMYKNMSYGCCLKRFENKYSY